MALERRRVYVNEFWYLISKESSPASIVGFKCVPYPSSRIIFYVEQICLNSTCKKLLFLWLILCKLFKMRIFTIDTQVNGNIQITKHKRQPLGLQASHYVEVELNEQTIHSNTHVEKIHTTIPLPISETFISTKQIIASSRCMQYGGAGKSFQCSCTKCCWSAGRFQPSILGISPVRAIGNMAASVSFIRNIAG